MTMTTELSLSEALLMARKQLGYSQIELASKLGVSRVTVWHWEHRAQTPVQLYCRKVLRELFTELNIDFTLPVKE